MIKIVYNLLLLFFCGLFIISVGGLIVSFGALNGGYGIGPLILALFVSIGSALALKYIYKLKAGWLKRTGIYASWSNCKALITESKRFPAVSNDNVPQFIAWIAALPFIKSKLDQCKQVTISNHLASKIHKEIISAYKRGEFTKDQRNFYIDFLIIAYFSQSYLANYGRIELVSLH